MKLTKLTYAGHSAVFFESKEMVVAIDPWLEGNPRCPTALKTPTRLDLIVLTHAHSDHAGDAVRLARLYKCKVIAIVELAGILEKEGIPGEQLIAMNKGGSTQIQGLTVTLTHALHTSSYDANPASPYAGEACGVVLSGAGPAIYHAGDTALFSDIQLIRDRYHPEIALLPIGDFYTMGPAEAAIAARFSGCRKAIPIHYKTSPKLVQSAEEFVRECRKNEIEALELEPGESLGLD